MKICEYPAIAENLRPLLSLVSEELIACGTETVLRQKTFIILEELFYNTVMHAYAGQSAPGPVRVTLMADTDAVSLLMEDRGQPFNPLEDVDDNERLRNIETLTEGKEGLFLVKNLASSIDYTFEDGWNKIQILVSA